MLTVFSINPLVDITELADAFLARGRVSIPNFLHGDGAERLRSALASRGDWYWAINAGESVYDLDFASLSPGQKAELDQRVNDAARDSFQFRFSSIRVPDPVIERKPEEDILHAFAEFMRSAAVLDFFGGISGRDGIAFADAQATAYRPGDFLTGHDDDVEGKDRELAYVLGLTPHWRAEWGGLLLFHGDEGRVSGFVPRFNCLNLFALPIQHSVSQVTPFAGDVRYSVTGWLRTKRPD